MADGLEARGRSVRVLSTDAFLLNNDTLNARGLQMRKGFPESYDHVAIATALRHLRSGQSTTVNVYSHEVYDIVAGTTQIITPADLILIEGVVALQQPIASHLDLALYVDAPEAWVQRWFVERFIRLTEEGRTDPSSFYHRFAGLPRDQVSQLAEGTWQMINVPNLHEHIAPSVENADVVVVKAMDHSIAELRETHRISA
jgi:type I pantothenate kinase